MAVTPSIIPGPAVIKHSGFTFYSKDGFRLNHNIESFPIVSDMVGQADTRKLKDLTTISWTPDGQVKSLAKYFPHALADIGKSIFGKATGSDAVEIWTQNGQKHTWHRGAVWKSPQLRLKPSDTLFGDMEIVCIGKAATQRTDAAYFKTLAATAFADTTYDETSIMTAQYSAAWGAAAPYDAMGSLGGFEIDIEYEMSQIDSVDFGVAEITLDSIIARARFIPNSLTEAQLDTLIGFQGADAIGIGESFAKAGNDLVIASDVFSATIHKAGPAGYASMFARGKHRHDAVEWFSKRTWTNGVGNPLWTFAIL